jgi:hypothetical protein
MFCSNNRHHVVCCFLVLLLLLQSIHSITSYNHSGTYNCQNIEDPTYRDTIGPNFYGVPPATNTVESKSRLNDREYQILSYYSQLSLPLNNSNDNRVGKDARVKTWSVLQICGLHGVSSVILCLSQYFRVFVLFIQMCLIVRQILLVSNRLCFQIRVWE